MPSTSILKWTSSYRVTTSSPFTSRNKRKTLSLSSSQSSCSETPVTSSGIINSQDIRPEEDQITTEMTRLEVDSSSSRSSSRSSNSSWWSFLYPSNTRMYFVCKYQEYKRNKKENNKRKVTERELSHLNHKIDKLLIRLDEHEHEAALSADEECVICINAKATMQTFPCGHRVVCRRCFVKTIQVAVSQRMLPLRCVICRTKILKLKQTSFGGISSGVFMKGSALRSTAAANGRLKQYSTPSTYATCPVQRSRTITQVGHNRLTSYHIRRRQTFLNSIEEHEEEYEDSDSICPLNTTTTSVDCRSSIASSVLSDETDFYSLDSFDSRRTSRGPSVTSTKSSSSSSKLSSPSIVSMTSSISPVTKEVKKESFWVQLTDSPGNQERLRMTNAVTSNDKWLRWQKLPGRLWLSSPSVI